MYCLTSVQKESLRLLTEFDRLCKGCHLQYWLAGGTLLGAIRHKGFIPWDDDIDVVMLRADYDRLAGYLESTPLSGTFWESAESKINKTSIHLHGKICETASCFRSRENDLFHFGIDVFPLDGVRRTRFGRCRQYVLSTFYKHLLPLLFGGTSSRYFFLKVIAASCLRPFFKNTLLIARLYRRAAVGLENSYFLFSAAGRYGWKKETFPARWFERTRSVIFENRRFPAPDGAEAMLAQVYGDGFMKVTPRMKSAPHYRVDLTAAFSENTKKLCVTFVLATCGRTREVAEWLSSAAEAARIADVSIQLIVADQNEDDRLKGLLAQAPAEWCIEHVKIHDKGVCLARNAVLDRVTGDVVAFPDDDCVYAPTVLQEVVRHFKENFTTDIVVGMTAKNNNFSAVVARIRKIGRYTLFRHGEMYLQFYRREILNAIGEFDEDFGPGERTKFPFGGDDSDYLARAVLIGFSAVRLPSAQVGHPVQDGERNYDKVEGYGNTRLALLSKLGYPSWFKLINILFPLAMMLLFPQKWKYYWAMFCGRVSFWVKRMST